MKCKICGKRFADDFLGVCESCAKESEDAEYARKIRNIADILNVTASADGNIKGAVESLLEIAMDLEVFNHAEKQEKEQGKA